MDDKKTVMSWLEGLAQDDWREWHSDSEVQTTAQAALDLLKAQEADSELLDKALETLVDMEFDIPCDAMFDSGWCEEYCNFDHPQKECWKKYLERFKEG